MRRFYLFSDGLYRLTHAIRRNKLFVAFYALICVAFVVIGVVIGVNMESKTAYVLDNGGGIFRFLRGDRGGAAFFFIDLLMSVVYALFSAVLIYPRPLAFLSISPALYRSYSLGLNVCVIVSVYSASALPMLFVLFVPVCIVEIIILCMLSFGCIRFSASVGRCAPTKGDVKYYLKGLLPYFIALAVCSLVKAVTAVLFGSALIGIL